MEKVSSSLAVLAEKRLKFGISPGPKFENANLMAEAFPLFPCLVIGCSEQLSQNRFLNPSTPCMINIADGGEKTGKENNSRNRRH